MNTVAAASCRCLEIGSFWSGEAALGAQASRLHPWPQATNAASGSRRGRRDACAPRGPRQNTRLVPREGVPRAKRLCAHASAHIASQATPRSHERPK